MDASGTINSIEELEQLTYNLVFKLEIQNTSEALAKLTKEMKAPPAAYSL
jgi:hypothetical protein